MSERYDIAIVGAGPAGASLAIRLAMAGKRVILAEKETFPRQKLCGEFISPECLTHFAEIGVLDDMRAAGGTELRETVFYSRSGRGVAVPSAMFGSMHKHALGLSRAEMDLRLLQGARAAGTEVREGTSGSVMIDEGRAVGLQLRKAGIPPEQVIASLIVDATGRTRALSRRNGAPALKARLIGFKTHATGVEIPSESCEIFSYRGGYGGTSRVEGGLHNICFIASANDVRRLGSDAEAVFREIVCSNRRAAQVFRDVRLGSEWLAVPIDRFGRGELSPMPGMMTVGDAASFIDPFTGSGMLLALESARIAAASLDGPGEVSAEYQRRYSAAFDRRLRICSWIRRASLVPFFTEAVVFGLGLSTSMRSRLVTATRSGALET